MLRFRYRRCTTPSVPETAPIRSLADRSDLRIRNLLDDPRLRRSMGLPPLHDLAEADAGTRYADRRRLLDRAAA